MYQRIPDQNDTNVEELNVVTKNPKLAVLPKSSTQPLLLPSKAGQSLDLFSEMVRNQIVQILRSQLNQLGTQPDKRFEGVTDRVTIKLDKDQIFKVIETFPQTNGLEREKFDTVWNLIGGVEIELLTPQAFFEKDYVEVGRLRKRRFYDEYGWDYPLIYGLDLSIQDLFSYIGIARCKYGIIGTYRDVYSSKSESDNPQDIFGQQENIAFQILDKSPLPGKEEYALFDDIKKHTQYEEMLSAAEDGSLSSIERFSTLSKKDFLDKFPDEIHKYRYIVNAIGTIVTFALLTASSLHNHKRYSIIQTNEAFLTMLRILLGDNKGIFHISSSLQYKREKDGTQIEDDCLTSLVDFKGCVENCRLYLPELVNLVNSLKDKLQISKGVISIDKVEENDRIKSEQ